MTPYEEAQPGRLALEGVDAVLAARPEKDGHLLTAVNRNLCAWRDALIARHRATPLAPAERDGLERLNGVIAVAFGVQYPQGPVDWNAFQSARGWLCDLLAKTGRETG